MPEPLIGLERLGDVALLRLNDPERRNAMTEAMGRALAARVQELAADAAVRAVVITGAGRAFSAGGDLTMIEERARAGRERPGGTFRDQQQAGMRGFYGLFLSVRALPMPSLAALNGAAVGAGLAVALACDLRIASREAKLGLNFTRLGISPGMGSTWTLPRLVGPSRAAELLFTGRLIDGTEAERIGLVDRAVAPEQALPDALALAEEIAGCAPVAVRATKQALGRAGSTELEQQLDFEAELQAVCYESADLGEGLAAVRERRPPRFAGR